MCTLKELEDGTYSIYDLMLMNELLDFKQSLIPNVKGRK